MASEATLSDHSTTSEQVKEELREEVKTSKHESDTPVKESVEPEKPKAEDLSPSPAVPLAETEEKIEDKPIETPIIEEVKKTEEEEKPKSEDLPSPVAPLAEAEEKVEDKQSEPSITEEVKRTVEEEEPKAEELPTPAAPLVESVEIIEDKKSEIPEEKPTVEASPSPAVFLAETIEKIEDVPPVIEEVKQTIEKVKDLAGEGVPSTDPELKVDDKEIEPPVVEEAKQAEDIVVDDKQIEPPVVAQDLTAELDTPNVSEPVANIVQSQPGVEPVTEAAEKPDAEEPKLESVEDKLTEEPKTVDIPESSVGAVQKKGEKVEDLPVKESEPAIVKDVEAVAETLNVEAEKPQESIVVESTESLDVKIAKSEEGLDKVEDAKLLKEEESIGKACLVTEGLGEVTLPTKEDQIVPKEDSATDVAENASVVDKQKELVGEADPVEGLLKEEIVDVVKVEAENEARNVAQSETKEAEGVISSISTTEAAEKTLEGVIASRDIELVAENGKEEAKGETVPEAETVTNGTVEKIVEEATETEPEKPEAEVKGEGTILIDETKLEKEADDTKKPDDTITSRDLPKEEVSVKSAQKQSNTILSKVKHKLVKAKKAIIGKSTNSKAPSSEPKGEVKVPSSETKT